MTGICLLCERRAQVNIKYMISKTVVRPAMTYGLETAATTTKHERQLEVAELTMVTFSTLGMGHQQVWTECQTVDAEMVRSCETSE